jgi:hypothetical protein
VSYTFGGLIVRPYREVTGGGERGEREFSIEGDVDDSMEESGGRDRDRDGSVGRD